MEPQPLGTDPLLEALNPEQREAVTHRGSPLLILAGAGSGKTRVITVKIAWMIRHLGCMPKEILALTFTNKAAKEMQERACALEDQAREVMLRTFHSFGAWFLRRHHQAAGLSRDFCIYDDDDTLSLLQTLYPQRGKAALSLYASAISRLKDQGIGPDSTTIYHGDLADLPQVYTRYQQRLAEIGNCDFGDLILKPLEMLAGDPDLTDAVRRRFRQILVDEYQDTNLAQYRLLRLLAGDGRGLTVVGDDDQSIYGFRGAQVRNILDFSQNFPGTRVVRLEENYRSDPPILRLADAVVSLNQDRLGKTMRTARTGGSLPVLGLFATQEDELAWILERLIKEGSANTAILYRTNSQSRSFETALLQAGIPYRIVGSVRFYEREEVKDCLALLRFLANPKDEVAFRRMVNKPPRGLGAASQEKVLDTALDAGGDLLKALELSLGTLGAKARKGGQEFCDLIRGLQAVLDGQETETEVTAGRTPDPQDRQGSGDQGGASGLGALVDLALDTSGLREFYSQEDRVKGTQRIQNLEELANAASLFGADREGLSLFLESLELDSARENGQDDPSAVTLITMHNTKGLEFDRVYLSGLEDGIFPRNPEDESELQEERRLLYVALTRARFGLTLSACSWRRIHGQLRSLNPSRFLGEMPAGLLDTRNFGWSSQGAGSWRFTTGGRSLAPGHLDPDPESGSPEGMEGQWYKGCKVYHEDYGAGMVFKSWVEAGEEVCMVQFESGRKARFIPRYSSLERLSP